MRGKIIYLKNSNPSSFSIEIILFKNIIGHFKICKINKSGIKIINIINPNNIMNKVLKFFLIFLNSKLFFKFIVSLWKIDFILFLRELKTLFLEITSELPATSLIR